MAEVRTTMRVFNLVFRVPQIREQFAEVQRLTNQVYRLTMIITSLRYGARYGAVIPYIGPTIPFLGAFIAGGEVATSLTESFTERERHRARTQE